MGQQVDHLIERGILRESESRQSTRGRPPRVLSISPAAGTVVVADVDTAATQVAIADLTRHVIAQATVNVRIDEGPDTVLNAVTERALNLLDKHECDSARVRAVVIGLPGRLRGRLRRAFDRRVGGDAQRTEGDPAEHRQAGAAVVRRRREFTRREPKSHKTMGSSLR